MNRHVHRHKSRLDNLFINVEQVDDLEMQAQWARYLCVLVSGFIEESIRILLSQYTVSRSSPEIANYVEKKLGRETNLNMTKIISLLAQFDNDFGETLRQHTEGELKDAVDSVIANRHPIAHGRDVSVSFIRLREWYEKIVNVIEIIEALLS